MSRSDKFKRMLNRIHWVIETHPYVSGLMTRDIQRDLKTLSDNIYIGDDELDWEPESGNFPTDEDELES